MSTVDFWCTLESVVITLLFFLSDILKFEKRIKKQLLWWTVINLIINIIFIYYL